MKTVYVVAFIALLLSLQISFGEDSKREDIGLRQNGSLRRGTLRVAPPIIVSVVKTAPANPHNRGPTSLGGPATKSKNTAAINGTGMKR